MDNNIIVKNKYFRQLKNNIEHHLDVTDLQTYFPVLDNYNHDEYHTNITLKSRYSIRTLLRNNTEEFNKKQSPYIKTFYTSTIYDRYKKINIDKHLFIKKNPIIDVVGYCINQFSLSKKILPDYISSITSDYINNFNNEAYIDAFFTYLGSKLTESGKCPTFPIFYGTYTCISKNLKYDITEDYSSIKSNKYFKKNITNKFSIEEIVIDLDTPTSIDLEIVNQDLELDDINALDLDSIRTQTKLESLTSMEELDESYKYPLDISDKTIDTLEELSDDTFKYLYLKDFPTQLICMEKLEKTLDDLLDEGKLDDKEWLSILFQICFGLAVAQKKFHFVHNDLHSSNIMFTPTQKPYLYYNINNKMYKIPTYGRITKIIDFGRATFTHNKTIYFSSTFDEDGDAEGQYDYPENNSLKHCNLKPNKSFDLARLATTIIEHFDPDSNIFRQLLKPWMTDKYNFFLINEKDDFDLYKKIAKDVCNAVPIKQLSKPIFRQFIIQKCNEKNVSMFIY